MKKRGDKQVSPNRKGERGGRDGNTNINARLFIADEMELALLHHAPPPYLSRAANWVQLKTSVTLLSRRS